MDDNRAVCKRCGVVMRDMEPGDPGGEFWHPTKDKNGKLYRCQNAGNLFRFRSRYSPGRDAKEIVPFMRKKQRRSFKRLGVAPREGGR